MLAKAGHKFFFSFLFNLYYPPVPVSNSWLGHGSCGVAWLGGARQCVRSPLWVTIVGGP